MLNSGRAKKYADMLTKPGSPTEKEKMMKVHAKSEFQSKFLQNIPVAVEIFGEKNLLPYINRLTFLVPYHMTVSQFVTLIRNRLHLNPYQDFHLLLKKTRAIVTMSKYLGDISPKNKDKYGYLIFTMAAENIFGCPKPRIKPIRSKFPGIEPTPFGAPEPTFWLAPEQNMLGTIDDDDLAWPNMLLQDLEESQLVQAISQVTQNIQHLMPEVAMENLLPPLPTTTVPVPLETGLTDTLEVQGMLLHALHQLQTSLYLLTPIITSPNQLQTTQLPPTLSTIPPEYYIIIVKLNQLVPFDDMQVDIIPEIEPSADSLEPAHYIPLVVSLNELVVELQSQLSQHLAELNSDASTPAPAPGSLPHILSTHFFNPTANSTQNQMQNNSEVDAVELMESSTQTPVQHYNPAAHSLNIAHQFFEILHQNLLVNNEPMVTENANGAVGEFVHPHFSTLVQYFNAVVQHLQNHQNVLHISADSDIPESLHFHPLLNFTLELPLTNNLQGPATVPNFIQQIAYADDSDEPGSDDDTELDITWS